MIRDRNMDLRRKRVWIPVREFSGIAQIATSDLISAGAGAAILKEVGTTGIVGLFMDNAADDIAHVWMCPSDVDPNQEIGFRVHWTNESTTAADTVDWKVLYTALEEDGDIITPATALDTAIAQDTCTGTVKQWQRSPRGTIAAGTLAAATLGLLLLAEMDALAGGLTEDVTLLGLEIDYQVRACHGAGKGYNVPCTSDPLGLQL